MIQESPLLSFFDKIYIINLAERSDRRRDMVKQLEKLNPENSRKNVSFFSAIKPQNKGDFPSIGCRGCFLSHLAVLKNALLEKHSRILIVEDDLSFNQYLIHNQGAIINELSQLSWDFCYLGHSVQLPKNEGSRFVKYEDPIMLAHFVGINKRVMKDLVAFLEAILTRPAGHPDGGPMHVDGAYSTFRKQHANLITLVANPSLGFQRSSPSDIAGHKWFDTIPLVNQLAALARKLKNLSRRR